ncbi:hypothetical protein FH972_023555 [Carpinus fangiana]|uniref:Uncharacterized protein n=1 Tax=Carpinus fangiana TaxID=176857 RepID=A0A5N6KW11_9ROSI|nr:hypothetical protein FH972_023555 [Carpinus fangiana]
MGVFAGSTRGRKLKLRGQMGVRSSDETSGWTMLPPLERLDSLGEEAAADEDLHNGQVRVATAMDDDFIHGKGAIPIDGVIFAVDCAALRVKDAHFEAIAQQDARVPGAAHGLATHVSPSVRRAPEIWARHVGAGHVYLAKGSFVLLVLPFAQKTKRAHAKGQNGRHRRTSGEQRGCMKNCAIAAECGDQVYLLVIVAVWILV